MLSVNCQLDITQDHQRDEPVGIHLGDFYLDYTNSHGNIYFTCGHERSLSSTTWVILSRKLKACLHLEPSSFGCEQCPLPWCPAMKDGTGNCELKHNSSPLSAFVKVLYHSMGAELGGKLAFSQRIGISGKLKYYMSLWIPAEEQRKQCCEKNSGDKTIWIQPKISDLQEEIVQYFSDGFTSSFSMNFLCFSKTLAQNLPQINPFVLVFLLLLLFLSTQWKLSKSIANRFCNQTSSETKAYPFSDFTGLQHLHF